MPSQKPCLKLPNRNIAKLASMTSTEVLFFARVDRCFQGELEPLTLNAGEVYITDRSNYYHELGHL